MRLAVLSDIDGNAFALEAVLADLQHIAAEQAVCLGNAIQGGPQPAEVVAHLRALACPVVMGNADTWLLTGQSTGNESIYVGKETIRQGSLALQSAADRQFIVAGSVTTRTGKVGRGRKAAT